ncbi:MAG: TetR/AcrR family transcriptional regulator [Ardenticatenaceae bacterium]
MSPRTADVYQQIKDERRETILDAARQVFARNGLAATRISDIAAEAGVSQGLFYHYFDNKEALFTEIVEAALRETAALTANARQSPGSAWQRLHALCEQMLSGVLKHPEFPLVILQAFTSEAVPDEARAAVERYGRRTFQDLVALIREGQAQGGVVASDPVELVLAFTACIQGVALNRLHVNAHEASVPRAETILRLLKA